MDIVHHLTIARKLFYPKLSKNILIDVHLDVTPVGMEQLVLIVSNFLYLVMEDFLKFFSS